MRMANHGLVIYKDNSFEAIRTDMSPGISDKHRRDTGVVLLIVIPHSWLLTYRQSLPYFVVGRDQEELLVYDAAMAWVNGTQVKPHAHRQLR
jgi:hypothetical protein